MRDESETPRRVLPPFHERAVGKAAFFPERANPTLEVLWIGDLLADLRQWKWLKLAGVLVAPLFLGAVRVRDETRDPVANRRESVRADEACRGVAVESDLDSTDDGSI